MTWVEIVVDGDEDTLDILGAVSERVDTVDEVFEAIHTSFMAAEESRFDEEGPGWAPLAESTLQAKAEHGWSDKILQATGQMMASFINPDAPGHLYTIEASPDLTTVEMGSDYHSPSQTGRWAETALAAFPQEGTTKMVARPIIDDLDTLAAEWNDLVADWISGVTTSPS